MTMLQEMGERIRRQRERHGLRQHDIARALQVSPQAVSKWERGDNSPDVATLGALARLLGVSTDWLLGLYTDRDQFEATVLASSVSGAYRKSRTMSARDFAAWVNGFLFQLTEAVLRGDGVPIKYIGDGFLAFFSGAEHRRRALASAFLARRMVAEELKIGLSTGEIFLGSVGHPDYAQSDIMGEVVNVAFLTMGWAQGETESGIAATDGVVDGLGDALRTGKTGDVTFHDLPSPVRVVELIEMDPLQAKNLIKE